jgi:guanylate kinase
MPRPRAYHFPTHHTGEKHLLAQNTPTSESNQRDHDARLETLFAEGDALIAGIREANTPRIFIISGPSGVGKDTVIEQLRETFPSARYVVTATTRPMRDGETDGVHYVFLTKDEFLERIEQDDFIENALVYENHYGVPRSPIVEGLAQGRDVIIKVDVKGAATLRRLIQNTISIFLAPESMEALYTRLRDRKTDQQDVLMKRFTTASTELKEIEDFDYVVFNEAGKLDDAVQRICEIVHVERSRVTRPEIRLP